MFKIFKKTYTQELILYNNILALSRNKLFYTVFNLDDSFQNRIYLIFLHISFLFIKVKSIKDRKKYDLFYQKMFDLIFNKIEINMREIGYGDTTINKNMKFLVRAFYNILLNCEKLSVKTIDDKKKFYYNFLQVKNTDKTTNKSNLVEYFNKYQTFCFDLSVDSVLRGDLNFKYK